jgi:hypothetical protein
VALSAEVALPRGMSVGPTCQVSMVVGPTQLRLTNRRVPCDISWLSWPNRELPHGTGVAVGFLNLLHFMSPDCTRIGSVPKLYLEKLVIKSQPLINSFNLFHLL